MPRVTEPEAPTLAEAKLSLMRAAAAIDPLAPVRKRPFVSVGVAAGAGAILGASDKQLATAAQLSRAMSAVLRLFANAAGRYAATRINHAATGPRPEPETGQDAGHCSN